MRTITEIFQRVREKFSRNQGTPGNTCLIYFENLAIRGEVFDGNVMVAQVGNMRGPWKAAIYLRQKKEFTDPTSEGAIDGLERVVKGWVLTPHAVEMARLALERQRSDILLYFSEELQAERLTPVLEALEELDEYAARFKEFTP